MGSSMEEYPFTVYLLCFVIDQLPCVIRSKEQSQPLLRVEVSRDIDSGVHIGVIPNQRRRQVRTDGKKEYLHRVLVRGH